MTRHRFERGNSLVGVMVTIVLILVLAVFFMKGSSIFGKPAAPARKDGKGTTVPGAAMYAARDEVCRSNLGQVRASFIIYQTANEDKFPETLDETKLGNDFYRCPLGKEPYKYDPATGTVSCVHPGHEKY